MMKHGNTCVSTTTPPEWLRQFLQEHAPACPRKCAFLDQGGELCDNPEVHQLFTRVGYEIRVTGADGSSQNSLVARGHGVIADAICSMLLGASLLIKFWSYAFHQWLQIDDNMLSRDQELSSTEMDIGKQDDFSSHRTFGCRIWVHPIGHRQAKLCPNSWRESSSVSSQMLTRMSCGMIQRPTGSRLLSMHISMKA